MTKKIKHIIQGLYGISESEKIMPNENARFILNKTIECLEIALSECEQEIQQYHAIGTAEEFGALKEKAKAKKPIYRKQRMKNKFGCFVKEECWECSTCGKIYLEYYPCEYCDCGQHLDWS